MLRKIVHYGQLSLEEIKAIKLKAQEGSAFHQNEYGLILARGHFGQKNKVEAAKYFQMAAEQGYPEALWNLANYLINDPEGPHDEARGLEVLNRGCQIGLPFILNQVGYYYRVGHHFEKNFEKAKEYFFQAAEAGNPMAQYNLGGMYAQGEGFAVDYVQAFEWIEKAAQADLVQAIGTLGEFYVMGIGCFPDLEKGLELLSLAVGRDYPQSMFFLGQLYENGQLVEQDYDQARFYFQKATQLAFLPAYTSLANLMEKGLGGPQDLETAQRIYKVAAKGIQPNPNQGYRSDLSEYEKSTLTNGPGRANSPKKMVH
ncbi:MAG: sel1 repeat family protein [Deltaproteobacteria bacterium]|jgi:TPR repeat protein|nr:sel1 repeat family protein [Deltaproteobacteria bacterium]